MRTIFVTLIIILAVTGCKHTDSNQESSPLVGEWITVACEESRITTNTESNVSSFWSRGLYEFTVDGRIAMGFRRYEDSSCSGEFYVIEPSVEEEQYLRFNDLGRETLEEGIDGGRIQITIPLSAVPADASNLIEGFYTINNGSLCFSQNIGLDTFSSSLSPGGNTAIDFEKCLTKLN